MDFFKAQQLLFTLGALKQNLKVTQNVSQIKISNNIPV